MLASISFEDAEPIFAQHVVNAIAEAYKEINLTYKQEQVTDATDKVKALVTSFDEKRLKAQKDV